MKRSILNSPRLLELKKHRRRDVLKKILLSVFALLLIFTSLVFISRISNLNIKEVKIIGENVTDAEKIKEIVLKEITGNYLYFFPKTNFVIYPRHKIEIELKNKFKNIQNVFVNYRNKKTLEISITEREAKYTWCGNTIDFLVKLPNDDVEKEKCYFMDDIGFVFDEAPYFSGEVYFKFYGLIGTDIGTYFSKENFKQLIDLKNTLATMKLRPISLFVGDDGDIKIFLSNLNKTSIGPYIIFKTNSDFKKKAENLEAALFTEPLQSNLKNKYSSLLYIDLRFGNKVYYKFR